MASFMLRQLFVMTLMHLVNTICYQNPTKVQCPDGKVLAPIVIASDHMDYTTQLLKGFYTSFVGKQTYTFDDPNIQSLPAEVFLKGIQCVPADHLIKRCNDQNNRHIPTTFSSGSCGYIIGCMGGDPQRPGWSFALEPFYETIIFTYTYMVVGHMWWEIRSSSAMLHSGTPQAIGNTSAVLRTFDEKPTFIIGYEVLPQSSALPLLGWKHGDCWKRHYPDTEMYQDTPLHYCGAKTAPSVKPLDPPAIPPDISTTEEQEVTTISKTNLQQGTTSETPDVLPDVSTPDVKQVTTPLTSIILPDISTTTKQPDKPPIIQASLVTKQPGRSPSTDYIAVLIVVVAILVVLQIVTIGILKPKGLICKSKKEDSTNLILEDPSTPLDESTFTESHSPPCLPVRDSSVNYTRL